MEEGNQNGEEVLQEQQQQQEQQKQQQQQQYLAWLRGKQYHAFVAEHCQRKLEEYITASFPEILSPFPEFWPSSSSTLTSTSTASSSSYSSPSSPPSSPPSLPSSHSNSHPNSNSRPQSGKADNTNNNNNNNAETNTTPPASSIPESKTQAVPLPKKIFNRSPHPEDDNEDIKTILALGPEIITLRTRRKDKHGNGHRDTSLSPTSPFFSYFDWQPVHKPSRKHSTTTAPLPAAAAAHISLLQDNPSTKTRVPNTPTSKEEETREERHLKRRQAKNADRQRKKDMRPLVRESISEGKKKRKNNSNNGNGMARIWSRCWESQREKWSAVVAVRTRSVGSLATTLSHSNSNSNSHSTTNANTNTTTTTNRGEQQHPGQNKNQEIPKLQYPTGPKEAAENGKGREDEKKKYAHHEYPRYPEFARQGRERAVKIAGRVRLSLKFPLLGRELS